MRQRRHIPTDRMQVSLPNCVQLSLFGISPAINELTLLQPIVADVQLMPGDTLSNQPNTRLAVSNSESVQNSRNYRLTTDLFGTRTVSERIKANLKAIRLSKQLKKESREVTSDEKGQLVQFSGWGGLASAFEEGSRFASLVEEVLTSEERQSAATSCLTAFYTPPTLITAIW